MTLDDVRRLIEPEKEALRAKGVAALYVFGSVARGEAGAGERCRTCSSTSAPNAQFSLIDLVGLQQDLSERFGADADVTTRDGLHWRIRDKVVAQAVRVF